MWAGIYTMQREKKGCRHEGMWNQVSSVPIGYKEFTHKQRPSDIL